MRLKGFAIAEGIIALVISAVTVAIGVSILNGINTTGWSAINVTTYGYIGTFLIIAILGATVMIYRYG
jgi:hypothetical protein